MYKITVDRNDKNYVRYYDIPHLFTEMSKDFKYIDLSQFKKIKTVPSNLLQLKEIRINDFIDIPDTLFNVDKIILYTGNIFKKNTILISDRVYSDYAYYKDESNINGCDFSIKCTGIFKRECYTEWDAYSDYNYDTGYDYNFDDYDSDINPYDSDNNSGTSFDSFDTISDKTWDKFYTVIENFHAIKIMKFVNQLKRFKQIKNGFKQFLNLYKQYKQFKILWKIAEYYSARKYAPKYILNYTELD